MVRVTNPLVSALRGCTSAIDGASYRKLVLRDTSKPRWWSRVNNNGEQCRNSKPLQTGRHNHDAERRKQQRRNERRNKQHAA